MQKNCRQRLTARQQESFTGDTLPSGKLHQGNPCRFFSWDRPSSRECAHTPRFPAPALLSGVSVVAKEQKGGSRRGRAGLGGSAPPPGSTHIFHGLYTLSNSSFSNNHPSRRHSARLGWSSWAQEESLASGQLGEALGTMRLREGRVGSLPPRRPPPPPPLQLGRPTPGSVLLGFQSAH